MKSTATALLFAALLSFPAAHAGSEAFHEGGLIKGYGRIADVPSATAIPPGTVFKVAFDLKRSGNFEVNRKIDSAARFLNMHHAAGVPGKNMQLAVVVHGAAYEDLLTDKAYGGENPNAELIRQLRENGVRFYLCGQTAAYRDVSPEDLLPGIEISLSAMTTHALLQQQGYTLNPF